MTKGQSVFPTNQKRSSNSGFWPSLKNENSRFKKMETENSFSFNDTIIAKYLTYKNDNLIFKLFFIQSWFTLWISKLFYSNYTCFAWLWQTGQSIWYQL